MAELLDPKRLTGLLDVRTARLQRGLTQEQVSVASGVGLAWLSRVERGVVVISPRTASALAPVLGVDADDLLRGQVQLAGDVRQRVLAGIAEGVRG